MRTFSPGLPVRWGGSWIKAEVRKSDNSPTGMLMKKIQRQALLLAGETLNKDRLGNRLQSATARALQNTEENQERQARGDSAKKRTDDEGQNASHVEALAPEEAGEPAGQRKDDRVRDEVGSEDPGAFVDTGGETASNVGKSDVGNAGIENLHEGGEHDREGDDPGADGWPGEAGDLEVGLCECRHGRRRARAHINAAVAKAAEASDVEGARQRNRVAAGGGGGCGGGHTALPGWGAG